MLKKQQNVKAVKYICAFGLRDKFQPVSLLKGLLKNAEEMLNTLRENINYPVDKKDEVIDNIVASLREALVCIFHYKLESEYSPECMEGFNKQLIQEKEDEKLGYAAKQEAEKNCKSATVVPDPAEGCITTLTSPFRIVAETSHVPKGIVIRRQLTALREVIKCIEDHQLEVEYPPENLLAQVKQLVEQAKEVTGERCQSYGLTTKQHAASGSEAQTHEFVNKPHAASGPEAQTRKRFKRKRCAAGLDHVPKAQT